MRIISKIFFFGVFVANIVCFSENLVISGVDNTEISDLIKSSITSSDGKYDIDDKSVSSVFRIKRDISTIKDILYAFGYFDATVSYKVTKNKIEFNIKLNERYKFHDVLIKYKDFTTYKAGLTVKEVFDLINIEVDSYVSTKQLSEANNKLKRFFQEKGFAFVEMSNPKIKINSKKKNFKAVYSIELNKKIIIDKTEIKVVSAKNKRLTEINDFVKARVLWKKGDVYNVNNLNQTKEDLMNTGIFSSIEMRLIKTHDDTNDENVAYANVVVEIKEALKRGISVGLKYGTSEKIGANFEWIYYNIDGKGSKLSTAIDIAKQKKKIDFSYNKPDIFFPGEELKSNFYGIHENTSAYNVKNVGLESILWHRIVRNVKVGVGAGAERSRNKYSEIKENDKENKKDKELNIVFFKKVVNNFYIPIGFDFDTTEVFLDPQSGVRSNVMLTNYFGKRKFSIINGKCALYVPMSSNKYDNKIVLSGYVKAGSILTSKTEYVPKDKLFFGGGANSVRGYGYQKLGIVDDDKTPIGGKSILEFGIEPRVRISENIGIVGFIESGRVFYSTIPSITSKKLLWGGGVGVRYYTPVGPIRFDIAFPFKRRKTSKGKNIDSLFNIYISIGQSF